MFPRRMRSLPCKETDFPANRRPVRVTSTTPSAGLARTAEPLRGLEAQFRAWAGSRPDREHGLDPVSIRRGGLRTERRSRSLCPGKWEEKRQGEEGCERSWRHPGEDRNNHILTWLLLLIRSSYNHMAHACCLEGRCHISLNPRYLDWSPPRHSRSGCLGYRACRRGACLLIVQKNRRPVLKNHPACHHSCKSLNIDS